MTSRLTAEEKEHEQALLDGLDAGTVRIVTDRAVLDMYRQAAREHVQRSHLDLNRIELRLSTDDLSHFAEQARQKQLSSEELMESVLHDYVRSTATHRPSSANPSHP